MSLINEALKKAQKLREAEEAAKNGKVPAPGAGAPVSPPATPPPPPSAAPPAAAPEPEPDPEPGPQTAYTGPAATRTESSPSGSMKMVVGVVVVVGISFIGWWLISGDDDPDIAVPQVATKVPASPAEGPPHSDPIPTPPEPVAAKPINPAEPERVAEASPVAQAPASTQMEDSTRAVQAPASRPTPSDSPAPEQAPTVKFVLPRTATAEPKPESAVESAATVSVTPPAATPASQPATASPNVKPASARPGLSVQTPTAASGQVQIVQENTLLPPQPAVVSQMTADPAILAYLETVRVTGVRASATDPKVLMNSRVYRLNDLVDRLLQLRVTKIESRELQFTDSQGFVYTKSF